MTRILHLKTSSTMALTPEFSSNCTTTQCQQHRVFHGRGGCFVLKKRDTGFHHGILVSVMTWIGKNVSRESIHLDPILKLKTQMTTGQRPPVSETLAFFRYRPVLTEFEVALIALKGRIELFCVSSRRTQRHEVAKQREDHSSAKGRRQ